MFLMLPPRSDLVFKSANRYISQSTMAFFYSLTLGYESGGCQKEVVVHAKKYQYLSNQHKSINIYFI